MRSCVLLYAWIFIVPVALFGMQVPADKESDGKKTATKEADEEIVVDCRTVIERSVTGSGKLVTAVLELPPLEGAKKYRLNITLMNPHETPIQFSSVNLSCGCGKFVADANEIPEFGTETFVLHLNVPNQFVDRRASHSVRFSGVDAAQTVLTLRINYDVSNVFAFVQDRAAIEILKTENVAVAKLPVRLVPPMTLDKLTLQVSENLRDIGFKVVGDDDSSDMPYVLVEAAGRAVPRHGIRGDVVLRRAGTDHNSLVQLSISHKEAFTLRPESLRLTRDNQSKPYEATAMLRVPVGRDAEVDRSENPTEMEDKKAGKTVLTPPQVGLVIGGEKARVLVKQLGQSGIYQLTIRYDGQLDERPDDTLEVRWTIVVNGVERVIDSHAFFSNR